ncbi:uncharacterized protein LAESUDRAFT_724669 [Laetiporus sulphureus 93-53]|uniref:Uncharacterized protein n=1 Tax=Laetiporus sulphureus 93-53 TaxID=1314785 RepID=A0A165ESS9_9APHY|nr:uncharacterized protein LAESUDRAFT_724669 [Laetiporus sulphureus 93-53]KZT07683.1 hypothetical protein LAESUDRAFT_724669 [Laetiporus sulphureus 93-53]
MSCSVIQPQTPVPPGHPGRRKRTMSFSAPPPHKSPRTNTLRRTGSYLSLEDMQAAVETTLYGRAGAPSTSPAERTTSLPRTRSMRHLKEERDRRKAASRSSPAVIQTPVVLSPAPIATCAAMPSFRTSSPLSPRQSVLPARASFPRSKQEPDLYRAAIAARMRMSPEGRRILYMGPRLALSMYTANRELEKSIYSATSELERIVAASQGDADSDVVMADSDPALSKSWVVVPPEDWEMVDCSA